MAAGARPIQLEPYDQGYRDGWHDIHVSPLRRRKRRRARSAEYALGYAHGRTDGATWGQYPEWADFTSAPRITEAPSPSSGPDVTVHSTLLLGPFPRQAPRKAPTGYPDPPQPRRSPDGPPRTDPHARRRQAPQGRDAPDRASTGSSPCPAIAAPSMPKGMDEAARRVWRHVVREMAGSGVITAADTHILRCYCEAWSRYRARRAACSCAAARSSPAPWPHLAQQPAPPGRARRPRRHPAARA